MKEGGNGETENYFGTTPYDYWDYFFFFFFWGGVNMIYWVPAAYDTG